MWRSFRQLGSKLRDTFTGVNKREMQERLDVHRLYLYTRWHELSCGEDVPDSMAESIVGQAAEMSFEDHKREVQRNLQRQLLQQATAIHGQLLQAGDPATAAQAFVRACQRTPEAASWAPGGLAAAVAGAQAPPTSGGGAPAVDQAQLAALVADELGFCVRVAPSTVQHQEAGLGLFVGAGEVAPGTLVALFPGLVYGREHYRRMPNYPKVDMSNPYLIARYDARIVDSQPWGRGWLPPPGTEPAPLIAGADDGGGKHRPRRNFLLRMASASDGPVVPLPAHGTRWVVPTSGEAAALEALEGRHPLALAHYANHPGRGGAPNAMVAPISWRLPLPPPSGAAQPHADADGEGVAPWVRAYLPTMGYGIERPLGEVLGEEVHGVGLVAVRRIHPGEEVLFNYRLSPGLGRPRWYHPVDGSEEERRWG